MDCYIKNYPRPQLTRPEWTLLDGAWDFAFDDENQGKAQKWFNGFEAPMQINVPFTYETVLSGINDQTRHDYVWYQKEVELNPEEGKRILLHFEGSDFETSVWVNGIYQGSHRGGYARFSFDITDAAVAGKNRISVHIKDTFSVEQPRGKQRWLNQNFGCWYVQNTGIWKSVWLETVSDAHVEALKITPIFDDNKVEICSDLSEASVDGELRITVSFQGRKIVSSTTSIMSECNVQTLDLENFDTGYGEEVKCWAPGHPHLYDLKIELIKDGAVVDTVGSYFGFRKISIDQGNILLNNEPIYQRLILDQGYWPQSGITPPSEEALIEDIDKIHALGYNGLRKHMKVEDEKFLYWCDVKGMLVWSEMAAYYQFSDASVREYTKEWMEVVRQNYSHPAIITWTPFNESWGVHRIKYNAKQQQFTQAIYHLTKSFDSMRPVITNDGWEHTVSDIITIHDYEEDGAAYFARNFGHKDETMDGRIYPSSKNWSAMADGYEYKGQPVIVSEYGGIAFSQKGEGEWGYGNSVKDEEAFLARFKKITDAIKDIPWVVGFCYTQVSDVEQEVNGLMTPDREFKIAPEKIAAINLADTPLHK